MAASKAKTKAKAKPEKAPRELLEKANGVTKPKPETNTGRVWAIVDNMKGRKAAPPARKDVIEAAVAEGINQSTAATQYGRWRQFHGFAKEPRAKAA